MRTEVNSFVHDVLTQRCILKQQIFRNTLPSATQSLDKFAYHLMKGPGYTTLIEKFWDFIFKIKNTSLFIIIDIFPFKVIG